MNPWVPDEDLLQNLGHRNVVCPGCGLHIADLVNSRIVGCGMCLLHFRALALPVVVKAQGGSVYHTGKWPDLSPDQLQTRIMTCRSALAKAQNEGRIGDIKTLQHILISLESHFG